MKRTISFTAYTTDRIRIVVDQSKDGGWSRITEVEAWTASVATPMINYALASNGSVASSSSMHDAGYAPGGAVDNVRSGANWGAGGGWNDATPWQFPDWMQVQFNGQKTINHVVVYSVQDNYSQSFRTIGLDDVHALWIDGFRGAGSGAAPAGSRSPLYRLTASREADRFVRALYDDCRCASRSTEQRASASGRASPSWRRGGDSMRKYDRPPFNREGTTHANRTKQNAPAAAAFA